MEENIQDIKRNVEEVKNNLKIAIDKNQKGIPANFELILIIDRVWDIEKYITDMETFI